VAVISDVHSNVFALTAVLEEIGRADVQEVWLCGDAFGYYPWASATFRALARVQPLAVLGNHDQWVLRGGLTPDDLAAWPARHNRRQLARAEPAALEWLADMDPVLRFTRGGWIVTVAHGTPQDPLHGRYYPDDREEHPWLPERNEIVILGQTHYPLVRGEAAGGLLLNPGSVGQPRDGASSCSWALLDLGSGRAQLRRTAYDHEAVMRRLANLKWDERLIRALARDRRDRARAPRLS
jgi:predicted phosphodiesterase